METIHSSLQMSRKADMVVQYSLPSRLRRYDLILLDEASQVEDRIARKLLVALGEVGHGVAVGVPWDPRWVGGPMGSRSKERGALGARGGSPWGSWGKGSRGPCSGGRQGFFL